jgi:hypothetical protein
MFLTFCNKTLWRSFVLNAKDIAFYGAITYIRCGFFFSYLQR